MDTKVISTGIRYSRLPASYVRPESERPKLSEVEDCEVVLIIDIGCSDRASIVRQIGHAGQICGCFQVTNHGVLGEPVLKMPEVAHEFFQLPVEEKMKLYSDDPSKSMRLSTSFNVKTEKIHNWRDYLRLHRYPLDQYVPEWPSNPSSFNLEILEVLRLLLYSSISPSERTGSEHGSTKKVQKKVCSDWISGNCVHGENCKHLHSWFSGNGFSLLAKLEGHNKAVTGIALPSGSDKLYSGAEDKTLRVWDCNSGQCVGLVDLLGEIGSMISQGPWVFVGLPNAVKAWNTQTLTDFTLNGPVGQVYAMALGNDMLFAGTQDGTILAWKSNSQSNCPELAASLKGHSHGVVSLVMSADRLYSGSVDKTIRVWDLNTFKCTQTLIGHTGVVMSVLCWESYLLSCSSDGTIKVWVATEGGDLEVTYTHKEDDGVLALCGIHDAEAKPILLCSCNDNSVRLYDLPSFTERGRLFAKQEVRAIQIGPGGLFFTGDATGQLAVWKLAGESSSVILS